MFKIKNPLSLKFWLIGLALIFTLIACTPEAPLEAAPTIVPEITTVEPEPTAITETPTVQAKTPSVLLVSEAEFSSFVFSQILTSLESLTADAGMELIVLETLSAEMITPEVRIVIGLGANLDLNGLAMNLPGVTFLAIGDPSASVATNLSVIGDPGYEIRQKSFMAGYLTGLVSSDYKIAALINGEHPEHDLLGGSFVVGGRFYCGICQPLFPPYNVFPQWEAVTSEPGEDGFRPVVNDFDNKGVDVVYVHGELITADLLNYLDELGMKVVSDQPPDIVRGNWVGTLTMDPVPAIENLWPDLLVGQPGVKVPAVIILTDMEMGHVSAARYRLFEEMAEDLQAGLVSFENTP